MHGLLAVASEVLEDRPTSRVRESLEKIVRYGLRSLHEITITIRLWIVNTFFSKSCWAESRSRSAARAQPASRLVNFAALENPLFILERPSAASGSKSSPPHTLVFAPPTSYHCSDENLV